jgi:hypothetical protein
MIIQIGGVYIDFQYDESLLKHTATFPDGLVLTFYRDHRFDNPIKSSKSTSTYDFSADDTFLIIESLIFYDNKPYVKQYKNGVRSHGDNYIINRCNFKKLISNQFDQYTLTVDSETIEVISTDYMYLFEYASNKFGGVYSYPYEFNVPNNIHNMSRKQRVRYAKLYPNFSKFTWLTYANYYKEDVLFKDVLLLSNREVRDQISTQPPTTQVDSFAY